MTPRRRVVCVAGPALQARLVAVVEAADRPRRPLLRFVTSIPELAACAAAGGEHAALLDLAGGLGLRLEDVAAARLAAAQLPLVVVVSDLEEDLGDAALRLGAQDYLLESDVCPRGLERSLRAAVQHHALQCALERERADLAASRASMVELIEANADGLIVLDRRGVARFANPAAQALFGSDASDLVGQPMGLPLPSEGSAEIELRPAQGSVQVVEVRSAPVCWEGEPAYLASLRDVTDRKRAERAMQRSAEGFRALAEAATDPIVVYRGDTMLWANRAFAQLLAAESTEAARVGSVSAWLDAAPEPDDAPGGGEASREPQAAVVRTRRGTAVPVEARRYRIVFEGVDATLALMRDLAAYEQESRARAQHERLASLGRLAANLGHEINNPLSYVVSNLSYLDGHLVDLGARVKAAATAADASARGDEWVQALAGGLEEARSAAADALEGAERVAAIVRDVRVLSRIESRELISLSIPDVLQSAVRIARGRLAEVAQVTLALEEVPAVRANSTALLQVFVNLLVNAADACSELPSERHDVRVSCFTDAEGRAVVEIRDTGPGVSEDIREHLFEPFFTTKPAGTGFGLAISFAIVESLAGSLTLESVGLRGAVARVVLPPVPTLEAPPPRRVRSRAGAARSRSPAAARSLAPPAGGRS